MSHSGQFYDIPFPRNARQKLGIFRYREKNGKVLALASSSELKSSSIARRLNRAEDSTRLLKVCISIVLKLMRQTCMGTDGWFPGCDRIGENGFNKKLSNCFSNTSTDFSQTKNIRLQSYHVMADQKTNSLVTLVLSQNPPPMNEFHFQDSYIHVWIRNSAARDGFELRKAKEFKRQTFK